MDIELSLYETRVIGSLLEKETTTPEHYPLSLNALLGACNQKSNRDPVLELDEATVRQTVEGLIARHLVSEKSGFGSRVSKYQHRFCNTEFGTLRFSPQERGIIGVLLLRGPQTPGELRGRTARLCNFADVGEVEATLEGLMQREDGPFVARLPREPGRREHRYAHCFSGPVESVAAVTEPAPAASHPRPDRLAGLEQAVEDLRRELDEIKDRLAALESAGPSGDRHS